MARKPRKFTIAAAAVAATTFVASTAASAFAWEIALSPPEVVFFTQPSVGNCYTNYGGLSGASGTANMLTITFSRNLNSSGVCLAGTNHTVTGSWMGAKSWIIKTSNGKVCDETTWKYNPGADIGVSAVATTPKSACTNQIVGQSRSRGYNNSGGSYIASNLRVTAPRTW